MIYVYSYLLIINIISFIVYFIDKRKAIKHRYRIPEKVLILISLFGGCFGSLLSMLVSHHKTKHIKFILLVPIFCLIWLYLIYKKFYLW